MTQCLLVECNLLVIKTQRLLVGDGKLVILTLCIFVEGGGTLIILRMSVLIVEST